MSIQKTLCRKYAPADLASASASLTVAFTEDPLMRTLTPDDNHWEKISPRNFAWICWMYHSSFGLTDVAEIGEVPGDVQCAAVWEPAALTAGAGVRFLCYLAWLLWNESFAYFKRCFKLFMLLEAKRHTHAPTAHHLVLLGSRVQGKGLGFSLIQVGIDRATALGLPCYLESSNPKNVPFYERHGFRTVELVYPFEMDPFVEGKGPVMTLMFRDVEESKKEK